MEESPQFVLPEPNIHHVILDCTTMSYLDAMGVIALKQVAEVSLKNYFSPHFR